MFGQEFQGHEAAKVDILGLVNHPHPAFSEKTHNSITFGNDLIGFEGAPGVGQGPEGGDRFEWILKESPSAIMLGKQALHFATNRHIPSAGFHKELGSPLWRLLHSGVKYLFDLFQLGRGHLASFPRRSSLYDAQAWLTRLHASHQHFHFVPSPRSISPIGSFATAIL